MPLLTFLFLGIFASIFALIVEFFTLSIFTSLAIETAFSSKTILFFLIFALVEETSKYVFLSRYKKNTPPEKAFTLLQALLAALFFGTGFFSLEYLASLRESADFPPLAIFQSLFLHISTTFLLLLFFFRSQSQTKISFKKCLLIVLCATVVHFLYNTLVFFLNEPQNSFFSIVFSLAGI